MLVSNCALVAVSAQRVHASMHARINRILLQRAFRCSTQTWLGQAHCECYVQSSHGLRMMAKNVFVYKYV